MRSPYGYRGAICEHFGWTYDYLLHGIAWSTVQKMMLDAPSYRSEKDDDSNVVLTDDKSEEIAKYLNSISL